MRRAALGALLLAAPVQGAELLYFQDFENPAGYENDGADVNIHRSVNQNYGDQPQGFRFAQQHTVETLNLSGSGRGGGSSAFGKGYSDPAGWGGNFAIGMLSEFQDDRLGLVFNLGGYRYLNIAIDVTSLDVSAWGGPYVAEGSAPVFGFTLFANGSPSPATHGGPVVAEAEIAGTASPPDTADWTTHKIALDAADAGGGWVILQIDLKTGGYAAFDNLRIIASDDPGYFGRPLKRPMR
jgi:hypothetical protein